MPPYYQPLLPDNIYHLFSRAVGSEKIFLSSDNYPFFLKKLKQHTCGVCSFYCYSLLPNHFHLLAKIKDEASVIKHFEEVKKTAYQLLQHDLPDFIMERFSNFLNSYTKAFNKTYKRKGALFMDYMKRSVVNKSSDFATYIWYIHKNAVHHGIARGIGEWHFDSYRSILSEAPTDLLRGEVIDWFGGRVGFITFHQQEVRTRMIQDL